MAPFKKVLVTGAGGFIGKRVCRILTENHFDVVEHHSGISDISQKNCLNIYNGQGITDVIHLAGKSFVPDSWNHFSDFISTNVNGTLNVLEFCKSNKTRIIFCSAFIYGANNKNPIAENAPIHPNNPYALSKKMAEDLCLFYQETFSIQTKIIRPFNVYGPGQREEFLIPMLLQQIKSGNEIRVKDLFPKRDYIYVDDLAQAFLAALKFEANGIYNIGSGKSTSVEELISIAQKALITTLPVFSEERIRPNEISDTIADISRAKNELKWTPLISLEQGILNSYNSFQS